MCELGLKYCPQMDNLCRKPYYNRKPNIGTGIRMIGFSVEDVAVRCLYNP